jgi:hypothetical protein
LKPAQFRYSFGHDIWPGLNRAEKGKPSSALAAFYWTNSPHANKRSPTGLSVVVPVVPSWFKSVHPPQPPSLRHNTTQSTKRRVKADGGSLIGRRGSQTDSDLPRPHPRAKYRRSPLPPPRLCVTPAAAPRPSVLYQRSFASICGQSCRFLSASSACSAAKKSALAHKILLIPVRARSIRMIS